METFLFCLTDSNDRSGNMKLSKSEAVERNS